MSKFSLRLEPFISFAHGSLVVYNHVLVIGVEGRTFLHLQGGLTYAGKRFAGGLALWAKMVPV